MYVRCLELPGPIMNVALLEEGVERRWSTMNDDSC